MKIISQETKDKIRNSHIGIKLSDETKKKISDAHKNKTIPNNVRDKISKSLNGIKKTKTHCLNISKSRKGRGLVGFEEKSPNWKGGMIIVSCSYCGCDIKRYAQRTITNDMQFCNRKCHGKWRSENLIGEKSTAWKKDSDCITLRKKRMRTSMKYKAWRESIFLRDDWTCQECGIKGGILNAHHIKPFAAHRELRFDIDNGITYCEKHHKQIHKMAVE